MDDPPRMLVAREVAPILRVSVWQVYVMARTGQLPVLHVGRAVRFPEAELLEWIRRRGTNHDTTPTK